MRRQSRLEKTGSQYAQEDIQNSRMVIENLFDILQNIITGLHSPIRRSPCGSRHRCPFAHNSSSINRDLSRMKFLDGTFPLNQSFILHHGGANQLMVQNKEVMTLFHLTTRFNRTTITLSNFACIPTTNCSVGGSTGASKVCLTTRHVYRMVLDWISCCVCKILQAKKRRTRTMGNPGICDCNF